MKTNTRAESAVVKMKKRTRRCPTLKIILPYRHVDVCIQYVSLFDNLKIMKLYPHNSTHRMKIVGPARRISNSSGPQYAITAIEHCTLTVHSAVLVRGTWYRKLLGGFRGGFKGSN